MGVALYIALAAAVLFFLYGKVIYAALRQRLRLYYYLTKVAGPVALPIVGSLWQFRWSIPGIADQLLDWGGYYAKQGHGTLGLWMGPFPVVFMVQPKEAKVLLDSNATITKGRNYEVLHPWLGTGLLTSTGDKWRSRRKMITPSFHFNVLASFITVHDTQAKVFLEQVERYADSGEVFDMFPFLKRLALDVICETAMGHSVEAQKNHDHPYVMAVHRLNEISFKRVLWPFLWIKPIWYASGLGYCYDRDLKTVTNFTMKVIDEKIRDYDEFVAGREAAYDPSQKKAFLDMLVEIRHAEQNLTYEDIREEVDTFMFEGHDTTSSSMGWTLWSLAHHPEMQDKIIEELDTVFGDSNRDCTKDDLAELKYLDKCVKESLRMFPPVPMFTRRTDVDIDVNGTTIPASCEVGVAPILLHRNPVLWDNPNEYNPENFNDENTAKRHPFCYVPFSAGPRNCIGMRFALMEEKTVLSWFFRRYRVTSDLPFESNKPLPELIIKPSLGFPLRVLHR